MSTALNFDATKVAPAKAIEPVPANWYDVIMDKSEVKPTKDGAGTLLEFQLKVISGEYANRKIFGRLNLQNANPVAQEIGHQQLSAICHAVGILKINDSQEIHGKPFAVKVNVQPATAEYEAKNDCKAFDVVGTTGKGKGTGVAPASPGSAPSMPPGMAPNAPAPVPFVPPTPAAPPAPPAPPAPVVKKELVPTAKTNGQPLTAYTSAGWNEAQLIEHGYAIWKETVVAPPAPPTPAAPPAPPAPPAPGGAVLPPWERPAGT